MKQCVAILCRELPMPLCAELASALDCAKKAGASDWWIQMFRQLEQNLPTRRMEALRAAVVIGTYTGSVSQPLAGINLAQIPAGEMAMKKAEKQRRGARANQGKRNMENRLTKR